MFKKSIFPNIDSRCDASQRKVKGWSTQGKFFCATLCIINKCKKGVRRGEGFKNCQKRCNNVFERPLTWSSLLLLLLLLLF